MAGHPARVPGGGRPDQREDTIELVTALVGLAVVDSINPSAMAVTLYLLAAGGDVVRRVLTYVAAIALTYLVLGVALVGGLSSATGWFTSAVESDAAYTVQAVVGAGLVLYGVLAPSGRRRPPRRREPRSGSLPAVFLLGVTVSVVELPTALPFLAAVGILSAASLPATRYIALLLGYTLILVLPPLLLLAGARLSGVRGQRLLSAWRHRLAGGSRTTFLVLLTLIGLALLADALIQLEVVTTPGFLPATEA